jgi:cysteine desulfurase/selenocysteine lyase
MKSDFPIFNQNPTLVYLDSAATALKPECVINQESEYYTKVSANIHRGLYQTSQIASDFYDQSRQVVADFINAQVSEIIFTSGTTASINLVTQSWGEFNINSGDEILITQMEHHSNLIPWQQLALKKHAILKYIPVTSDFKLDESSIPVLVTAKTKIVALTHISNVLGTINSIKEITQVVKKINPSTLVLVDGAQSVAHMPIDVTDLGIDFFAFSGHKLYGPTGVGVLFVKKNIYSKMKPTLFGGGTIKEVFWDKTTFVDPPEVFEPGTPPIAQVIGLAQAIKYINSLGWQKISDHETKLTNYAIQQLNSISQIKIFGPINNRSGVISFVFNQPKLPQPHDLGDILSRQFNVAVRTGFHCAMPLHQLFSLASGSTRISFGIYNTTKDIDVLVEGIKKSIKIFS